MKIINRAGTIAPLFAVIVLLLVSAGCGGGGGGGSTPARQGGTGRVSAEVTLTKRPASRQADQTNPEKVTVVISISGIYSLDDTEFPTVSSTVVIDLSQGSAETSVLEVPVGTNHMLTAIATWQDGFTETIKSIIPAVEKGETITVTADEKSTVIANAAEELAIRNKTTLNKLTQEQISTITELVTLFHTNGIAYKDMTSEGVLDYNNVCISDSDCNDNNGLTMDACTKPGTSTSACTHTTFACNTATDCNDSNAHTEDVCTGGGTVSAVCSHNTIFCISDSDCADESALTIDTCTNAGTTSSVCLNANFDCNDAKDCNDSNAHTEDVCTAGGTLSAACSHNAIVCISDTECLDENALTLDTCTNAGTTSSVCLNANFECNTASDCNDNNAHTADVCTAGGTLSAACSHNAIACLSNSECTDSDAMTADTCMNPSTVSSVCSFDPIACTVNGDCPDDGNVATASECVNLFCAAVEISVMGTVRLDGIPVADAVVRIYNETYSATKTTDANGVYYFTGVPDGTYNIIATKQNTTVSSSVVSIPGTKQ